MKKFILFSILLLSLVVTAQANYTISEARLRMNKTTTMEVTTTWKTIDFAGSSSYNTNTFGIDAASGNKMCYWDSTNKLIKFIGDYDQNHLIALYLETTTNLITTRSGLRVRFVIPNGISPGVDAYFPYSDTSTPYADVGEATLLANGIRHLPLVLPITVTQSMRTNGIRVEVSLSNSLITLGTCNLTYAALLLQE